MRNRTPKYLNVKKVSNLKEDKNGRTYRTVKLETTMTMRFKDATTGEMVEARINPKSGIINVWEESYLNNQPEFGVDFQVGEKILGDVVTMNVESYEIPKEDGTSRTANRYTCVVLGDTTSIGWNSKVERVFTKKGKTIINKPLNLIN